MQGETIPFPRYDVARAGMMSRLMRALGFARI